MTTVDADATAAYRRISGSSRLAWSKGRQPSGGVLYSSNELRELLQWLCHGDSTINTLMSITTVITGTFAADNIILGPL